MILYSLKCDQGHAFDSWFASAAGYEGLRAAGHVACPACGSTAVDKALMAPAVATSDPAPLTARPPVEDQIAAMRRQIEETSDYVGGNFAAEARAIHDGTAPERAIWGEARLDEAKSLIEDGIPVAPLPFMPKTRTN